MAVHLCFAARSHVPFPPSTSPPARARNCSAGSAPRLSRVGPSQHRHCLATRSGRQARRGGFPVRHQPIYPEQAVASVSPIGSGRNLRRVWAQPEIFLALRQAPPGDHENRAASGAANAIECPHHRRHGRDLALFGVPHPATEPSHSFRTQLGNMPCSTLRPHPGTGWSLLPTNLDRRFHRQRHRRLHRPPCLRSRPPPARLRENLNIRPAAAR